MNRRFQNALICLLGLACFFLTGTGSAEEIRRITVAPVGHPMSQNLQQALVSRCEFVGWKQAVRRKATGDQLGLIRSVLGCDRNLIYLRGELRLDESTQQLALVSGKTFTFPLEKGLLRLSGFAGKRPSGESSNAPKVARHVDLLIDARTSLDPNVVRSRLEEVLQDSKTGINVLAAVSHSISQPTWIAEELLRRTESHVLQSEGAGEDTIQSLHEAVKREVGSEADVILASTHTGGAETSPLLGTTTPTLTRVLQDLAAQVSHVCRQHSIDDVLVLPLVLREGETQRTDGMMRDFTRRIRQLLQYEHGLQIQSEIDVAQFLDAANADLENGIVDFAVLKRAAGERRPIVLVAGSVREAVFNEKVVRLEALRDLRFGVVAFPGDNNTVAETHFRVAETEIDRQQSDWIKATDPKAMSAAMSATMDPLLSGLNDDSFAKHPMTEQMFRPWITVKIDDEELEHQFTDNQTRMAVRIPQYVGQNPNEPTSYAIHIDNRGGEPCFLRLFVDGKNVLPQKLTPTSNEETFMPMVELGRARTFFVDRNKTYAIRGFFSSIKTASANVREFNLTDELMTINAGRNNQTGVITAAIYECTTNPFSAMSFDPNYATIPGPSRRLTVEPYEGNQVPADDHRDIVMIDYGF